MFTHTRAAFLAAVTSVVVLLGNAESAAQQRGIRAFSTVRLSAGAEQSLATLNAAATRPFVALPSRVTLALKTPSG